MDRVTDLASKNAAVIFTKSSCCMCHSIKALFYELGASPAIHEVDQDAELEWALKHLGCNPAIPAVFIGGIEFVSSFVGEVGDGNDIRFWIDKWVGEVRLCDRFPRLYHLDRSKECRVAEKGNWVDNTWCWEWDWVKNLRGRVCKDFEELQVLLQNVVIKLDCRDRWRWTLQENGDFTVRDLTKLVEEKTISVGSGGEATIWNKWVSKKVNIFVWRALKGRLPVRAELDKRRIDLDSLLCPSCGDMVESCSHCLVMCNFAMNVWEKVYSWWRIGVVNAFSIEELFTLTFLVIHLDCGNRVPFVRVRVGVGSHSRFCSNWSASGLFQVQGLIGGLGLLYKNMKASAVAFV
ncbi:reverse transcriptase domain, reverse transcriptase zinc-binding domain protein [Tanacetum coccineum]|uniref:Reverse transcriptase domain, reverse transcriptase zinc-binding domain protein n=1 Tax=Tanacetum coccineum TaxID=301880 RepID=A0ABQ5F2C8_9ASTR